VYKMGKSKKKSPPNQAVLDLIGNPNPWTPAIEKQWLSELGNLSTGEIYSRFPPLRKPPNVGKRGRTRGWGGTDA